MRPDEVPRIAHDPALLEAFYREHVEAGCSASWRGASTIRGWRPT
jgi:hypothetical protein